jgi:uncharacterized membrane protein YvbJ
MYCPKCGWNNADDATKCANCFAELTPAQPQPTQQMAQQPPQQQPYGQPAYGQPVQNVPDYLVWSILVTIFCCLIPGIVSIVKAASANGKKNAGDYYGALQDANAAKTWMWWSFGLGLAGSLAYLAMIILGATLGGMSGTHHTF